MIRNLFPNLIGRAERACERGVRRRKGPGHRVAKQRSTPCVANVALRAEPCSGRQCIAQGTELLHTRGRSTQPYQGSVFRVVAVRLCDFRMACSQWRFAAFVCSCSRGSRGIVRHVASGGPGPHGTEAAHRLGRRQALGQARRPRSRDLTAARAGGARRGAAVARDGAVLRFGSVRRPSTPRHWRRCTAGPGYGRAPMPRSALLPAGVPVATRNAGVQRVGSLAAIVEPSSPSFQDLTLPARGRYADPGRAEASLCPHPRRKSAIASCSSHPRDGILAVLPVVLPRAAPCRGMTVARRPPRTRNRGDDLCSPSPPGPLRRCRTSRGPRASPEPRFSATRRGSSRWAVARWGGAGGRGRRGRQSLFKGRE